MSAPWIVVTINDIYPYRAQTSFDSGHTTRFTVTMQNVADQIRGKIKSCPANVVSATAYAIPPELKWCACLLIVEGLLTGIPGLPIEEAERSRFSQAWKALDAVAACDYLVSLPTDPVASDAQAGAQTVVVSSSTRLVTRDTMSGI